MSDPFEDVYKKYIRPPEVQELEGSIECPKCDSTDVDRKAGYRGEYKCRNCGHFWKRT